mmetsp:Transcript_43163/g.97547  ORF Transcript_43163/g.97547 Transcript_43163/m.97547 type:complete len:236 (-) Transcript_43163:37-744(-)
MGDSHARLGHLPRQDGGAGGLHEVTPTAGVAGTERGTQRGCDAAEGSPGPDEVDKAVDREPRASRLRQKLWPGVHLVRARIAPKLKLVGPEGSPLVNDRLGDVKNLGEVGAAYLPGHRVWALVYKDDFGAKRTHHSRPLHAISSRHHSDERVPQRCANNCKSCPSVPRREFYYSLARRKGAVDSRLLDHLKRYPVFFRESRRQILQFDEQPAFDAFCRQKAAEVNARSVMDGVGS